MRKIKSKLSTENLSYLELERLWAMIMMACIDLVPKSEGHTPMFYTYIPGIFLCDSTGGSFTT